jgi:hypothetical protein
MVGTDRSGAGRLVEAGEQMRLVLEAGSARERAAVAAIKTCAPYRAPEELQAWGGFWVAIAF